LVDVGVLEVLLHCVSFLSDWSILNWRVLVLIRLEFVNSIHLSISGVFGHQSLFLVGHFLSDLSVLYSERSLLLVLKSLGDSHLSLLSLLLVLGVSKSDSSFVLSFGGECL
jgi:hypothetical protein